MSENDVSPGERPFSRLDLLVARDGVEPSTFRFSVGRSYQLSYLAVPFQFGLWPIQAGGETLPESGGMVETWSKRGRRGGAPDS
jgi:hypothetical protein